MIFNDFHRDFFRAHLLRSVVAAGVLFFAMLGPICARLVYFGSQSLFVTASKLSGLWLEAI